MTASRRLAAILAADVAGFFAADGNGRRGHPVSFFGHQQQSITINALAPSG
jgi:hypothetical protein